ncbi:MAG: TIGR03936 family radical SAM-associated protein [Lachnospiraceae bacterium]|nr:TIGR03936 family radical SAM-associated protein [Lachnospiraceae bacterium]
MKVRIKFKKEGLMKYIGHLDVMRYFQKLLRRADIPIAYSSGMSPHQIMSFAMPLSMGLESDAEYVDIEITEPVSSALAIKKMNDCNAYGIEIISFKELPEGAKNAMASIKAADYAVSFREGYKPSFSCMDELKKMYEEPCINVIRHTKKSEGEVDIKPGIYSLSGDDDRILMCLSCGSVLNIKPELLMGEVYKRKGLSLPDFALAIRRLEIYTEEDGRRVSLDEIGTAIDE